MSHPEHGTLGVKIPSRSVTEAEPRRLVGGVCPSCKLTMFPVSENCPNCWTTMEPAVFEGEGALYSYSVVHVGKLAKAGPVTLGYVDLPEGARVFAHIGETDEGVLSPDLPVKLNLYPDGDDYRAVWMLKDGGASDA